MNTERQQAKDLYMNTPYTQVQIAEAVGVDRKTISRWIKEESWDKLKQATIAMPALIVGNLFAQVAELQQHINTRKEGRRFPTVAEAEIIRRLINAACKMGMANSMNTNVQVMMSFSDYTARHDTGFTQKLVKYADAYFRDHIGKARTEGFPFTLFHDTKPPIPEAAALYQELERESSENVPSLNNKKGDIAPKHSPENSTGKRTQQIEHSN